MNYQDLLTGNTYTLKKRNLSKTFTGKNGRIATFVRMKFLFVN